MIGKDFHQRSVFATDVAATGDTVVHLRVFQEAYPDIADLGLVAFPTKLPSYYGHELDRTKIVIAFSSEQSRDVFEAWWKKYNDVFHGGQVTSAMLPTYIGEPSTVTMLKYNMKDVVGAWAWITRSCSQRVFRLDHFLVFASEKDATAFKMHFG